MRVTSIKYTNTMGVGLTTHNMLLVVNIVSLCNRFSFVLILFLFILGSWLMYTSYSYITTNKSFFPKKNIYFCSCHHIFWSVYVSVDSLFAGIVVHTFSIDGTRACIVLNLQTDI